MIEFRRVTWYSQIAAIILGLIIFALGFYFGTSYSDMRTEDGVSVNSR